MARSVSEIQKEIQSLSGADQVELLRALIEGLDEGVNDDVELAWLEEAQRRHRELLNGTVTATPAEEVIAKARARLKNEQKRGHSTFSEADRALADSPSTPCSIANKFDDPGDN